jgi:hypothetical protein
VSSPSRDLLDAEERLPFPGGQRDEEALFAATTTELDPAGHPAGDEAPAITPHLVGLRLPPG